MTRIVTALLMGAAIAIAGIGAPGFLGMPAEGWLPSSFITHTIMLATSLLMMWYLSRGALSSFGFKRGSFRMTLTILLWAIPTSALSVLQFVASRSGAPVQEMVSLSKVQVVLFVWIYASVGEEIFVRGLLQGYLNPLERHKITLVGKSLSVPVLFCALFFGAMHVVLWPKMGPLALVPMSLATLLGVVTGYYREKSGSLLPAILIHALFNIGGSLPGWVLATLTE
jgi:membrane protease YdiL (CAAX protease family)